MTQIPKNASTRVSREGSVEPKKEKIEKMLKEPIALNIRDN
jgi:hypothetical protein